jgi:hypothetical protein
VEDTSTPEQLFCDAMVSGNADANWLWKFSSVFCGDRATTPKHQMADLNFCLGLCNKEHYILVKKTEFEKEE